jgi:hypothetical protein
MTSFGDFLPSSFVFAADRRQESGGAKSLLNQDGHNTDFLFCESQWTAGSSWKLVSGAGQIFDAGEIVEAEPPRRLS